MKLIEIDWHPSQQQLRQFGLITLVLLPLIGWWFFGQSSYALLAVGAFAGAGIICGILAILCPSSLRYVFLGANIVVLPIGLVISEVVLLLVYLVVFWPIGAYFRFIGRDVLHRTLNRTATTYWQPKSQAANVRNYFRQS